MNMRGDGRLRSVVRSRGKDLLVLGLSEERRIEIETRGEGTTKGGDMVGARLRAATSRRVELGAIAQTLIDIE